MYGIYISWNIINNYREFMFEIVFNILSMK